MYVSKYNHITVNIMYPLQSSLRTISGTSLTIANNPKLVSVEGLKNLKHQSLKIYVYNNLQLKESHALRRGKSRRFFNEGLKSKNFAAFPKPRAASPTNHKTD